MKTFLLRLLLWIVCLTLVSCDRQYSGKTPPKVLNGVLDLTTWDFDKDGNVPLNGKWEFYWQQLLTPDNFLTDPKPIPSGPIQVPSSWGCFEINEKSIGHQGYATYRMVLKLGDVAGSKAIKIDRISNAFKFWINERLVSEKGIVGTSKETMKSKVSPDFIIFEEDQKTIQILIQASSYRLLGGLSSSLYFGKAEPLQQYKQSLVEQNMIYVSVLLCMGFYHLILFIVRRKDHSSLYLGLFCFLITLTCVTANERLIFQWFPDLKIEFWNQISNLPLDLGAAVILLFVKSIYPLEMPQRIVKGLVTSFGVLLVLRFSIEITTFSIYFLPFLLLFILTMFGVCTYVMILALKRQREGSFIFLCGMLLLSTMSIHDLVEIAILKDADQTYSEEGLLLFIMFQAVLLAKKFSRAFVTVEDQNERLLTLDQVKDSVLANTSHELRTPLYGIIGVAESLLDKDPGSVYKPDLELIIHSATRLSKMVNDILDFTQMKNRELQIKLVPVDVKRVTNIALALSVHLIGAKNILLTDEVPEGLPLIKADENRLQQVLFNLLGNAIKFTHEGQVRVSAWEHTGNIWVSIEDTGIGIPQNRQKHIFESFEQVDGSISREYGGMGIGLAVTKTLLELQGGGIEVKSEPQKGSTFSFWLPISEDQILGEKPLSLVTSRVGSPYQTNLSFDSESLTQPRTAVGSQNPTILVVEDEPVNARILRSQLESRHYQVLLAPDGSSALEILQAEKDAKGKCHIDLMLLDLMLPRMSGYDVCRKVRSLYSISALPVIILTAKNQLSDLVQGFECGANDYLVKPFLKEELMKRMETQLKLSEIFRLETQLRQAQKMEAIGTLSGGIAHEFNNILQIILGNADLLYADLFESSYRQYIDPIIRSGERGTNMIRQLLTFSRPNLQIDLERLDLVPLLKEFIKMIRVTLPKTVEIHQELEEGVGDVLANGTQIYQIIMNLFNNAIQAMPDGKGSITVTLKTVELGHHEEYLSELGKGRYIKISVRDTGNGILPQHKERIFEPFFSTKEVGKGTGLGLSVVHGIVKYHKGAIRVESEVGKGTCFEIFFPVVKEKEQGSEPMAPLRSERKMLVTNILLVDDEKILRGFSKINLKP
ncbi:ATP-binding protein [Deltaproteobacteria bacterium TL4]